MTKTKKEKLTKMLLAYYLEGDTEFTKLPKKQQNTIIIMFSNVENSGTFKRLKCIYDRPDTVAGLIVYWEAFLTGMHADTLFSSAADQAILTAGDASVALLDTAEQAAATKIPGKAKARNVQLGKTEIVMEDPLRILQAAGDADTDNAAALFQTHMVKIDATGQHGAVGESVKQGKLTGTIAVTNAVVDETTTFLRMISADKQAWYVGDWGTKCRGIISDINEKPLTSGTLYYVRTRTNGKNGKSNWGLIFEVYAP